MKRVVAVTVLLLGIGAYATSAQQAPRAADAAMLTLHEAVASAVRAHPSLELARAGVERADAGRRELQASLLPALTVESNATRFQEPMLVAPLHGFDPQRLPVFDRTLVQSSLTLAYQLFDGGARSARVSRATALRAGAVAQFDRAEQMLLVETARRYAAVLVARELVDAHVARADALQQERGRAAQLFEQGRVPRVALLRAAAALSATQAELSAARVHVAATEQDLARVMGVAGDVVSRATLAPAAVASPPPSRDAAMAAALASNPELRRLSLEVDAARATIHEAQAQWWPRLHFGGRYVHYASGAGSPIGEWQGGVQLSYPVFTAGARPAAIDRARAEEAASRAQLALARLQLADAIDRALAAADAALARAQAWQTAVAQLEEVARIERLALDTGAGVQTDWLAAQAELLRARASLTQARYDELVARIELARVTGELTTMWITNNVESVQ
jgi:outer membrane protein